MHQQDPRRFAELLTEAVYRIKKRDSKSISAIQDELGYALGRDGGSVIEYWRKGNLPPKHQDIEQLAQELLRWAKVDQGWLEEFLYSAGYGLGTTTWIAQFFPIADRLIEQRTENAPFQVPGLIPHFTGRKSELTLLCERISKPKGRRIHALVGMGGVGKSSLAIHIAHALRDDFADGVLWASASTSSPLDIIELWAREYDCDFGRLNDLQSRAAALRSLLAQKNTLVLLDDVTSAVQIQPLLPGSPGCVVLLTTRSEDVAVTLAAELYRLSELQLSEGLALLTALLGSERVEREVEAAKTICHQLKCLPLALEIVGQLLRVRSQRRLSDLSAYLDNVNNRLSLQISDRAVRTSFMASWDMLNESYQQTFACLGVFAAREFSTEAVAYVAEMDLYKAQDHLYTLVALSLVREIDHNRFQQHPLLAGFAYEQLGDASSYELRMARYYEQYVHHQGKAFSSIDGEWESVMAGMLAAHRLQEQSLVLAYGYTLCEPWFRQARFGQAREGYRWMDMAANIVGDIGAQAFAHQKWGWACLEQDDYEEAATHLHHSVRLYEALQDESAMAECFYWLARLAVELGTYADAQQHLEICHQVYDDLGDAEGLARTYYQQALLAYRIGEMAITQRLSQEAYAIQIKSEDKTHLLPILRLLADIAIEREDFVAANDYCQQALQIAQALQHRAELAAIYYSMTVVARNAKELDRALEYCNQASTLFETMGDRSFFALTLYERSKIDGLNQKTASALDWGHQSLALFQELRDDFNQVYVLHHLGQLYAWGPQMEVREAHVQARTYWRQADALAQRLAHPLAHDIQVCLDGLDASHNGISTLV